MSTAKFAGAQTCEINNTQTLVSDYYDLHLLGPATVDVPRWVEELLDIHQPPPSAL